MKIKTLLFAILTISSLMLTLASGIPDNGNAVEDDLSISTNTKIVQDTFTASEKSLQTSKNKVNDQKKILLINREIDTTENSEISEDFSTSSIEDEGSGTGNYYIVQFKGRITNSWKTSLEDTGAEIIGYVPNNAYLVKMNLSVRYKVESIDEIQWIGTYRPEYKISPDLSRSTENIEEITIILFNAEDNAKVSAQIGELGGKITGSSGNIIRTVVQTSAIADIAAFDEIKWVEKYVQPVVSNDVARNITGVSYVSESYDLTGRGQIIGIADTGLDTGINDESMHDDLEGRIINIFDLVGDGSADRSGHGTHVAGSVLGNGNASDGKYKGTAPEAQLVFQTLETNSSEYLIGIPYDLTRLFQQAYDEGARIHTNSWGAPVRGVYSTDSYYTDKFMWEHPDMLILFSAGNDAIDSNSDGVMDPDSIGAPGTAKNCLTVGASENYRPEINYTWKYYSQADPIATDKTADNIEGIAAFSSRGPTDDGRLKPDIVAPGTFIISTRSSMTSGTGWGEVDENYLYMGGTSMSTPITAGAVALVRQNYMDNLNTTPSAALIKATIINGAHDMTPGQYGTNITQEIKGRPDYSQGWGRLDIKESLYPSGERQIHFCDGLELGTGESFENVYYINNSSEPIRVTLVWSDYPGEPYAACTLVNDLDLYVIGPEGRTYKEIDGINNVEQVEIQEPEKGLYKVIVSGFNVPQGPQPFALVLSGANDELPAPEEIDFAPEYPTICIGDRTVFSARTIDQYGSEINADVKWTSENTTVGIINEDTGDFAAMTTGTTNITASNGNLNATATITVSENMSSETVFTSDDEELELRSPIFGGYEISEINVSADYNNFSYFYYDIDDKIGTEKLYINDNVTDPRTINESGLVYYTEIKDHDHAYADWGTFRLIGFFGEAYVPISSDPSKLCRLLLNDNKMYELEKNGTIELLNGYSVTITEIDTVENKAYVSLTKDGNEVESSVISSNYDYVYEMDAGSIEDVPLIKIHFNDIYVNNETAFVSADGVFQISDDVVELEINDRFGELRIVEIEDDHLKLSNINPVTMERGTTISITDDINIKVLDSYYLVFYFMDTFTDIGSYQLRGTVANSSEISNHQWDASSFTGLHYNDRLNVKLEHLDINTDEIDNRMIAPDELTYISNVEYSLRKCQFFDGYYNMGFFGKEYAVRKNFYPE